MPALGQTGHHDLFVACRRHEQLHGVDVDPARDEFIDRGEGAHPGPVGGSLGAALVTGVDDRDDLGVGVVHVRANVELVDPTEPDEGACARGVRSA